MDVVTFSFYLVYHLFFLPHPFLLRAACEKNPRCDLLVLDIFFLVCLPIAVNQMCQGKEIVFDRLAFSNKKKCFLFGVIIQIYIPDGL